MVSIERIETERLMLRRPAPTDRDAFLAIDGDPLTHLHNPAGPNTTAQVSERRLQTYMDDWTNFGIGYWTVDLKPHGEVIGFAGLRPLAWEGRDVLNLYYRFKPDIWGQGFATEAAAVAVGVGREHFPALPVVARTRPSNAAAIAVAIKVGLQRQPDLEGEYAVLVLPGTW